MEPPPAYSDEPPYQTAPEYNPDAVPTSPMDAPLNDAASADGKLRALQHIASKYELAGGAVAKLRSLESYDIVVIADDSGSMNNPAHSVDPNRPFEKVPTRWEELQVRVVQIMELACCLDSDGIDIYFLNRLPAYNVHDAEQAKALFMEGPNGYTPLSAIYNRVLTEKLANQEGKILIILATDGEPNRREGGRWVNDVSGFTNLLRTRGGHAPRRCPTSIMACTDAEDEIGWLNKLDNDIKFLDVVDDYMSERREVVKAQGANFPFNIGDYVVKTLLGSIDPLYDNLDEKRFTRAQYVEYTGKAPPARQEVSPVEAGDSGCCVIM